jgi:hypothetical protein
MSAYFSDHEVPCYRAPRIWPGNTKAVIPGSGSHGLEAVGANYTGGLQEGGPMLLVENLVSVTSYAPYPAIRPPCVAAAITVLCGQTSPLPRHRDPLVIG